jgi:hypothetical protein
MAHSDKQPVHNTMLCFGSLDFVFDGPVESPAGAMFSRSAPDVPVLPQGQTLEESRSTKSTADRVWNLVSRDIVFALGPNPSQELLRFAAYATSMLVFGLQEEEMLSWDEFKLCYHSMYPKGQTWLPRGRTVAPTATDDPRPYPSEASQASCDEVVKVHLGP